MVYQYVQKFLEEFNTLEGWTFIWNNPSHFSVANSILTITTPPTDPSPAWLRRTNFTWRYGKLISYIKFPTATGFNAGVGGYSFVSGNTCAEAVGIAACISNSDYQNRHLGHLTTEYDISSITDCSRWVIEDTPEDGNAFHKYTIEWTPEFVAISKDDVEKARYTTGIPTSDLDLYVGINCVGLLGGCGAKNWMDTTVSFPMDMQIQSIELLQLEEPCTTPGCTIDVI